MNGVIPNLEFLRPEWFGLGCLLLPWLVYGWFRSLVDFSPRQRRWSLLVRSCLILLLAAALAGLAWNRPSDQRFVVLAIDRSESLGREAQTIVAQRLAEFRAAAGRHRVAAFAFGAEPGPITPLHADSPSGLPGFAGESVDGSETDLARAIEAARAAIPPGYIPHVVLLTDGRPTRGNTLRAVLAAEMPISVVPLPVAAEPRVQVSEVRVPAQARVGEPFFVEIVITSNVATRGRLDLFRNGLQLPLNESSDVRLRAGETVVRVRQQLDESQTALFTALLSSPQDSRLDDNRASGLVVIQGQARVLLIDPAPETLDPLRWALEDQEMRVDVRPPSGIPPSLAELFRYDVIGLSNTPASSMTAEQQDALARYVSELGGGLMMLGGEQSFGLGGFYKTPIERALPIRCDLEQEQEKPSLAIVLVIDRSGSMGGIKLDLAKDAARGTVELLGPRDQIGVVAFDDDAYWVSELQSASDKPRVLERIDRLSAAGGTNLYPALALARAALESTVAKLKHVIVLSDGISAPADYAGMISDLVSGRITVSTVAVGDKADRDLLKDLAEQGGGRYYLCEDPRAVPQIFAQETILASKSAIEETPFLPRLVRATPVLRGIDLESPPPLLGLVITRAKPTSEVILVADHGEPVLAWWRYGLGMSLAFTSDAKSRWGAEWLTWPDYGAFSGAGRAPRDAPRRTLGRAASAGTPRRADSCDT